MRQIYSSLFQGAALAAALTAFGAAPSFAQNGGKFGGTLNVVWGDPRSGSAGGDVRFSIALDGGKTYPLLVAPVDQGKAITSFGKHVVIDGRLTKDAHGNPAIQAQRIGAPPAAPPSHHATETRRVLYILLKYQGDSQEPHSEQFYLDLTNPKKGDLGKNIPASINGFFDKTSWHNLQWKADVTDWMKLPHPKTYYANCGWDQSCANLGALSNDAFALAVKAGVNLSVYDNINFVINNDLDCCAWGGGTSYQGKSYGATWEPPWGQETSVYSHEFGHSIGLPHSGWTYYAYDSPWDIMSKRTAAKTIQCGSYFSVNDGADRAINCTEPGDGYIAPHKDYLGWLPAENQVVIDAPRTKEIKLEANALPLRKGIKLVKICLAGLPCTGGSAHYLSVEARIGGKKYENGLTGDGVIIQDVYLNRGAIGGSCYFNSQSGFAVPIDATPGDWDAENCDSGGREWPDYALGNAQFLPGQTYRNNSLHVSVQVKKQEGSSYIVKVKRTN
ncbi:MAG: hypothetical protein JO056_04380 [Alphaproteobacteria bacterium]|nr:hypothetical protein [Alphaproteobacteria bacterium]